METKPPISAISASRRKSHRYLHSPVTKHSITLVGHKTSVTLENQFWDGLQEIAHRMIRNFGLSAPKKSESLLKD
jgi:hypothetical protein